jgi:hypothetical protein
LRRLGCEVYWLEAVGEAGEQDTAALAIFRARMRRYGLHDKFILYAAPAGCARRAPLRFLETNRAEAEDILAQAELFLNFHYAIHPGVLARFRRTALVDIDPGLLQFWMSRGQLNVPRHDLYFTIGETVGKPGAQIPDCSVPWIYFRPPVCLETWPYTFDLASDTFTTISNWDSSHWVVDAEQVYDNSKRVSFLELAELPHLTDQALELALLIGSERDLAEKQEMERRGWRIRHSSEVAGSPEAYQGYIQHSRGEFSCAKRSCREFQNAWVSDRTLCYLASGKPVVVQDTGPSAFLPNGEGMFRFSTPQDAVEAFAAINADYERHCREARAVAETYFDATRTLANVLGAAGA